MHSELVLVHSLQVALRAQGVRQGLALWLAEEQRAGRGKQTPAEAFLRAAPHPTPQPTWSLAQAPVDGVDAGLRLQTAGGGLSQVAAEARVAGLAGQPLQAGVGEGGHVLPAPVGHVDLAQPHPGSDGGLVLQTHQEVSAKSQRSSGAANASARGISTSAAKRERRRKLQYLSGLGRDEARNAAAPPPPPAS